jgi:hypothetical protein
MFIRIPTIFYIAPNAAHIAPAQADEIRGLTRVKALALQGVKAFHYGKSGG